ncbi:MAG: 7TM diverse intracellular signaling domain-containing protein [Cryomorphaceae bacterium]|nr:SpoIIE family protein phosphatase [Flavobacteriales bacterium]
MPLKKLVIPALLVACSVAFFISNASESDEKPVFTRTVNTSLEIIGAVSSADYDDIYEIARLGDFKFEPVGLIPTFGFSDHSHYLRLKVLNLKDSPEMRMLEVKSPILNKCNLYEIRGSGIHKLYNAGDDYRFSARPVNHLNFQFPVQLDANSSRDFVLEVASNGEQLQVPIDLLAPSEISERDEKDRLMRGIYFGIILFVLLFNSFIYFVIKQKSSLYYVLYVFFLLMLQLSLNGFAFRYFWPNSPYLANVANPFFASVAIFALIRFLQLFLNLKEFFPKLNKAFKYVGHIVLINSLLALIYTPFFFQFSVLTINTLTLLLNLAIIPVVVMVLRKNFKPARFFLYAFIVLVASVFFFILNNFGVFQSEFYAAYGLQIGSAIEVILLSFAIVDKFKSFKDEAFQRLITINDMKVRANEILERKVSERTREINEQKQVVEKQNTEILDSIKYAKRIQSSILPTEGEINKLFPKNFVFFKPKDMVSGDFYWFGKTTEENPWSNEGVCHLFAAVDCTGHGVPGALMSILGYNGLEECVNNPKVKSPADVLNFINNKIIDTLQHDESGEYNMRDGMDMVFGAYNPATRTLSCAGAKNNVYILRGEEIIELKGDRRSIGAELIDDDAGYNNQVATLAPNDRIYTFTDGFPDQFGGPNNKKFKSKTLLQTITVLPPKNWTVS